MTDYVAFPHVKVQVADGAHLNVIVARAEQALKSAGVSHNKIAEFREDVRARRPRGYAWTVALIREWVDTD